VSRVSILRRPSRAEISDRARGAVLGLAVGDALGAALEWLAPEQICARYGGPLRDMVQSATWQLGEWTDDTAMMLALGESLADRGGFDEDDVVARYIVWARSDPRDIGVTVQRSLARARTPDDARSAATAWHEQSGGRSAGNGSLMRTVPIAIRYRRDPGGLVNASWADSSLTHHDPLAADACAFFNLTVAALLRGKRPPRSTSAAGRAAALALDQPTELLLEPVQREIGFVLTSLRVGYAAAFRHDTFEDAVVFAANLGGDADTNAAVAGALAGARFGADAIPQRWLEPLQQRDRISGLAMRLLRA
jgi:ADP-ribosyl-[dinitrogen reductase] hydrolase